MQSNPRILVNLLVILIVVLFYVAVFWRILSYIAISFRVAVCPAFDAKIQMTEFDFLRRLVSTGPTVHRLDFPPESSEDILGDGQWFNSLLRPS